MRAALAALLSLAACAPHYRVDELRALRAGGEEQAAFSAKAAAAFSEGKPREAARLFERAIELSPDPTADDFLPLARAREAAGEHVAARAAAKFGLDRPGSDDARHQLTVLLVGSYANEGLVGPALDARALRGSIHSAMVTPALERQFAALVEADALARDGAGARALERYQAWVESYGVPDHRLVREWADAVLRAVPDVGGAAAADARRAVSEKRFDEAVAAYALAYRFQPSDRFELARFAEAVHGAGEPAPTAEAAALAQQAAAALDRDALGEALVAYRKAVAAAPWWPAAHYNFALLLARAEQHAFAVEHMQAFAALAGSGGREAQALIAGWEARAAPPSPEQRQQLDATFLADRTHARGWRDRGWVMVSTGVVSGAGALACLVMSMLTNSQIRSGELATGADVTIAAARGQTYNAGGIAFGALAAGLVAIGLAIVLFNLDPAGGP